MKRALAFFFLALIPSASAGSYYPPPGDHLPDWSPDGTRIAFHTTRGDRPGFVVVGSDGSGEARLRDGNRAISAFSPDWKRFAERRVEGALYIDDRMIARYAQPDFSWAPDSDRLAFGGQDGLYVVHADGSGLRRVAEGRTAPVGGVGVGLPVWSPAGDRIAYQRVSAGNSDINLVGADGQGHVNLTENDGRANVRPLWSPDGRSIAFVTSDGRNVALELTDLAGRRRILPVNVTITNGELAWFPDSRRIAVETDAGLVELDIVTGRKRRWLSWFGFGIDWSPDGTRIAFSAGGECRDRYGIYVARADGTGAQRITNDCRIVGTAGPDELVGTDLADVLLGLAGNDRLEARDPGYVGDTLDGGPGNDLLIGHFMADTLKGSAGADTLRGGASADTLIGGPGKDAINGEGGRDTIEARDGVRDVVRCGTNRDRTPEKDTAFVDRMDRVARDCEVVRRSR